MSRSPHRPSAWRPRRRRRVACNASAASTETYRCAVPRASPAQRLMRSHGRRLPYKIANYLERRIFVRRLPFRVGDGVTLERRQGRLSLVELVQGASLGRTAELNAAFALEICTVHSVPHFVIPDTGERRYRIGVAEEHWGELVAAVMRTARQRPVYVGIEAQTKRGKRRRWSELAQYPGIQQSALSQRRIEVFRLMVLRPGGTMSGRANSCVLERWAREADGQLRAPRPNSRSTRIGLRHQSPTFTPQAGRWAQTLAAFDQRTIFDIDFPIDAVYTWVDGSDPIWRERRREFLTPVGDIHDSSATADERFRDNDELLFSLRSVEQYAPWLRSIILVTDRQVPSWLNTTHPSLRIVDHVELFGKVGSLPNFNSHAIGARLHHIEGLSEHYIYFNDDLFLGRHVQPSTFFHSNGVAKFFLSRSTLPFSDPDEVVPAHESARRNVSTLLSTEFGRAPTRTFFHVPITQRRSTMFELEERFPQVFDNTWRNRFRSSDDYEVNSWLHHYYGYLTGKSSPGHIRYDYFSLADESALSRMQRLRKSRNRDVFCINDEEGASIDHVEFARNWLKIYFPEPSSFEL